MNIPQNMGPNVWSTSWMNIPQTQGPNENYIIPLTLSLSVSPLGGVRDTSLSFCACFQSCLYMHASKSVMICVWKTCTTERQVCGSSSWLRVEKKTNHKSLSNQWDCYNWEPAWIVLSSLENNVVIIIVLWVGDLCL